MTQFLPPNLLALFAPRDPIPFLPPTDKLPWEKQNKPYTGVSAFLGHFEDPKDTPPPTRVETKDERKERKRKERAEQVAYKLEQDLAMWDPPNDPNIAGDAYKSLFVARIISLVHDINSGKPRGYAFVEYEHERDMHSAYKHADGRKIDGRRVLVDVERGRTVKGWRPRRLGGGLGSTRKGGPEVNSKYSGRDEGRSSRSRSRERRRSRSRSRERERRRRSRSPREARRRRSRSRERKERDEERRRRRSRSRHRSRSRDRKRTRRSRSRERKERKERKPDIKQESGGGDMDGEVHFEGQGEMEPDEMMQYSVKEEPRRGYMDEQEEGEEEGGYQESGQGINGASDVQ